MMDIRLIKLFNVALVENKTTNSDFRAVNDMAAKRGYFVHPDICNDSIIRFLSEIEINPNATFYKNWEDVTSKTRLELALDQVLHYFTTYGTDFSFGNGYVPNDGAENVPAFNKFKIIVPITAEELYKKCYDMLCSGIALKYETMEACADFIINEVKNNNIDINVDNIKNREGQIYICSKLNIWPVKPLNLFRLIIFLTTGNTMIIINDQMFKNIVNSNNPFDFGKLSKENMEALASIYLRFKKLFVAFKHNSIIDNKKYINKLRKLAIKHHKPMNTGFWSNIFKNVYEKAEIIEHLDEITTFKKITIMQACLSHISDDSNMLYIVRNGKQFLRKNYNNLDYSKILYYITLYNILNDDIVKVLSSHNYNEVSTEVDGNIEVTRVPKIVKAYDWIDVALPTSEKNFIGNYPFGTTISLGEDNFVGCYWRNEWGTYDYDLSLIDFYGNRISWNSKYYTPNADIVYSGDITNAVDGASEIIKIKDGNAINSSAIIKVNQYNGNPNSKFEFLFGFETIKNKFNLYNNGYMVDPNNIKFRATVEHTNKREMQLGLINDNKITLMEINTGNNIISKANKYSQDLINGIIKKTNSRISILPLLKKAGYTIVDESYNGDVDIDMAELNKDTLINILNVI